MNVNGNDAPDGTPLYMPTPTPAPSTSTSTVGNKIDVRDQNKLAVSKLKHAFDEDFPFRTEFADAKSTVFSNHFVLSLNTDTPLYEYNIVGFPTKIGPTKAKLLVHKMMEKDVYLSSQRDLLATDYLTRIIAWTKLDGDQLKPFVVTEEDDRVPISLEVQYLGIVDTSILLNQVSANTAPDRHTVVEDTQFGKKENGELGPLINAFNIIISKAIGKDSMLLKSNKMFVTSGHKTLGPSQTSSLCTMRGYFYTIKAGMGHVLLNLNACTSAFFRPMLVSEFLSDNDTFINKMNRCDALYGLRVFINYERGGKLNDTQARIKTINGTGASVATQEFTLNSGQTVTVQKYLEDSKFTRLLLC
jgi:eukaryotic translation initiation factor 2C